MPRNKGLATAVLIAACGLGLLWRLSAGGERGRFVSQADAAEEVAESGDLAAIEEAPDEAEPESSAERAKLELEEASGAPVEAGAFEADAVYGRLIDPDGQPVPEASVLLFVGDHPLDKQTAPLEEAVTDADGRYRFRGLDPFLGYQLYFEAEGFLPRLASNSPGHDEETELERAITISGRVLQADTERAIPGSVVKNLVRHWSDEGFQEQVLAISDADGTYRLPWARLEGMQRVDVRRPGHLDEKREFQVDPKKADGYDLRLGAGRQLILEVYDLDTGLALGDMEFELSKGHFARTDAAGRIDLVSVLHPSARDRRLQISIGAEGWCRTSLNFGLAEAGAAQVLRAPVTRGATLRGRVVNTAGDPVANALVRFGSRNSRSYGGRRPHRADLPKNVWINHNDDPVFSAPDGSFEITGVFPSQQTLQVYANHPDYVRGVEDDVPLTQTTTEIEVELELGSGSVLHGIVTVDGEPTSTHVNWHSEEARGWGRSNDRGEYRFRNVSAGEIQLTATVDDKSWSNRESDPETLWIEQGETREHDILITSNRTSISGVVRDSNGEPVPGAEVIAWASDDGDFHFSTSTNANEAGEWEALVEAAPGVMYNLYGREGARHKMLEGVAPGASGIELVLPELGHLRLAVQDNVTGDPVEGFQIYWRASASDSYQQLNQGSSSFSPGPDGCFIAQLAVGTLDLFVTARELGYAPAALPQVRVDPEAGNRPVRVLLERGVTVEVVFEYEPDTQKKVYQAMRRRRVSLVSEEQAALKETGGEFFNREVRYGQVLRINDSGAAKVKGIAPGTYSILASVNGVKFEPERFEIPHIDEHRVEIRVVKEDESEGD